MDIIGSTFDIFTEGEYAWPATPADDQKIVTAIKRGADAVITARSSRGTRQMHVPLCSKAKKKVAQCYH